MSQSTQSFTPSAVSAPGKVLLAGGYLVLDKKYSGLVFALSARIHCVSSALPSLPPNTIKVVSPQFTEAEWTYQVTGGDNDVEEVEVTQVDGNPNPFVQTTVSQALSYLRLSSIPPTRITIHADNAYYSQPPSSPRFNYLGVPISRAHKTGLGSSAALVTSLTACLLRTFTGSFAPLHNLAQSAHCAAQGKIGSGFDVSAAVHGSHVYHRFSPSCLESGGLREQVDGKWDHEVEATKVPKGLRLVMGDVDCGSSTPGMVRKVLAWRGSDETAEELWRDLEGRNTGLIELMAKAEERSREDVEEWQSAVKTWGTGEEAETESMKLLNEISKQVGAIREKIREMGSRAEVPIEPEAQTRLLDAAAAAVPGVLGGVVPGAGGYDAVVFLCVDRDETVQQLEEFLRGYKFMGEDGKGGSVAVLEAREEMEGVRVEDIAQY